MNSNLQAQSHPSFPTQYVIDDKASVLGEIYKVDTSLACYCQPAPWALSRAAHSFAKQQDGEVLKYQGKIDPELTTILKDIFCHRSHGNLIVNHIELMLTMFDALFEPKEIGLRVISCIEAHSPAFHENKMIARMASSLGGSGERWIEREHAQYYPLEKGQISAQLKAPLTNAINSLCDGDIAVYKGTNWLDHEHSALISASPQFNDTDAKLCIYIDFLD
ncbi:hypothetical protein PCIT_a0243 [Pseudoalteromonas citrea]|uniref:DUF1826 domain-containing protein n=2 Tax=Pseudoalteromonas citrea TaxID=43655 RepID=A0AAD4AKM6_9GAMM|nr:DUF1826 domain-containing protein [Pseudoalteromonas citrea]KAF7773900.1 hypothetical protein PCIT_a0243 [Pseudoalteromonas citrea]